MGIRKLRATNAWSARLEIQKLDLEQRNAFGWASVVVNDAGQIVIDHDKDVIPPAELEKAAYEHVLESRDGGEMHQRIIGRLIESVFVDPQKRRAMDMPTDGRVGWWVGYHVDDDATWEKVKSGAYPQLSIAGVADRVPAGAGVFKLLNLRIDEVSFVDAGAGIGVDVTLVKRAGVDAATGKRISVSASRGAARQLATSQAKRESAVHELLAKLLKNFPAAKATEKEAIAKKLTGLKKAASLEDIKSKLTAEEWELIMEAIAPAPPTDGAPEGSEEEEDDETPEEEAAEQAALQNAAPPAPPAAPPAAPPPKPAAKRTKRKGVEPTEGEPVSKEQQRIQKLETELAEVRKQQRLEKYRAEAAKSFAYAPGSSELIAKQLMAADDNPDKELGKAQRDTLKQAHERIKASALMRTFGSSAPNDGAAPIEQVHSLAKARAHETIAKSTDPKADSHATKARTMLKSLRQVAMESPELYAEYVANRRAQGGSRS